MSLTTATGTTPPTSTPTSAKTVSQIASTTAYADFEKKVKEVGSGNASSVTATIVNSMPDEAKAFGAIRRAKLSARLKVNLTGSSLSTIADELKAMNWTTLEDKIEFVEMCLNAAVSVRTDVVESNRTAISKLPDSFKIKQAINFSKLAAVGHCLFTHLEVGDLSAAYVKRFGSLNIWDNANLNALGEKRATVLRQFLAKVPRDDVASNWIASHCSNVVFPHVR